MLIAKKFCIHYAGRDGYEMGPLDFEVEEGAFCLVLGRNGSGKTTLLRAIYGLLKTSGTLKLGDEDLLSGTMDRRRRHMAWIGDEHWVESTLSMDDNLRYLLGLYPEFDRALYEELMEGFGLTRIDQEKPYIVMSTGQKVLAKTAFALARKPKLLLVDEPTMAMDLKTRIAWLEKICSFAKEEQTTVLMSTHELDLLRTIADRIILVEKGKITACERVDAPSRSVAMQRARLMFRTMTPGEEETYWAGKDGPGL